MNIELYVILKVDKFDATLLHYPMLQNKNNFSTLKAESTNILDYAIFPMLRCISYMATFAQFFVKIHDIEMSCTLKFISLKLLTQLNLYATLQNT